jgi:hypothetical protein
MVPMIRGLRFLAPLAGLALSCGPARTGDPRTPEERAVAFLAREVPAWPVENKCFSCHNNGDAARALYAARSQAVAFDPRALETTTRFLSRPEAWKENGPEAEFSDKKLAALQFAFALSSAVETGHASADGALAHAASMVGELQGPDGSWILDAGDFPGSPVTYGRTLSTVAARRILAAAGRDRFGDALDRADRWIRLQRPTGAFDAAALLIGLRSLDAPDASGQRRHCLEILRIGQARDGGWGAFARLAPEAFDTSVALLGLATVRAEPGVPEMIRRGRAFLTALQEPDGGWPETTRPPGARSYAHRISTTGWAALALLATR